MDALFVVFRLAPDLPLRAVEYHHFTSAHDVAVFMWGRFIGYHLIYKNSKLVFTAHQFGDIAKLEEHLEEWQPLEA